MLGEPILRLEECDSTNRVALDWGDAPHGACVVAASQTAGRGRLGRVWESAAGCGLYFSLVLRPETPRNLGIWSLSSALGVAMALEEIAGVKTRIKWPNDVLVVAKNGEARKIGGILSEARGEQLVIGIGVNLNQNADELPARPIFAASSLHLETGKYWEIDAVLAAILGRLDTLFARDWPAIHPDFRRRCLGLGEVVRVKTGGETLIGIFQDVSDDGALLLRTADGMKTLVAGDVGYF